MMRRLLAALLPLLSCAAPEAPRPRPDRTLQMLDRLSENMAGLPEGSRWRSVDTPSFRVLYLDDPGLAARVGQAAEETRRRQQALWLGEGRRPAWSPRCDIYLFPTKRMLVQFNGGDEARAGSAASRRSRLVRGQTLQRVMHLAADEYGLLEDLLPHEVSHIIVGGLMGVKESPRWADEGLAVLAMSRPARESYEEVLQHYRGRAQLFPLAQLMAMEVYPDPPFRRLFYAQSLSLVRFLLELADRGALLRLMRGEGDLSRLYSIEGPDALERRWRAWLP
jgi:hypothetical protein